MVRLHGKEPYKVVLVHGGPGAIGSLKGFAEELSDSSQAGVVEAIQTQYSIDALIDELFQQVKGHTNDMITLIGHSWGAWLVALFAEKHPKLVENLVLVGSGPLEDKYVAEIGSRRFLNISEEDAAVLRRLVNNQATYDDMVRIPKVLEKSDNYCLHDKDKHTADRSDSEMHNLIWNEAAQLRSSGKLLEAFRNIKSNLYIIHGATDPHPVKGITDPLQKIGLPFKLFLLEQCGHSPFMEKYAREEFYKILLSII